MTALVLATSKMTPKAEEIERHLKRCLDGEARPLMAGAVASCHLSKQTESWALFVVRPDSVAFGGDVVVGVVGVWR